MSASKEFIGYVMELLEPVAAIEGKRFFVGYGIKAGSTQFAMIMENSLYFVVDSKIRLKYEKLRKKPFSYMTKNEKSLVKRYYEVPEDLFEDKDGLLEWAKRVLQSRKLPVTRNNG